MEVTELAKELFKGHEVRVLGTPNSPLFVANDIGKILCIKNVRESISKFEPYKKCDVSLTDAIALSVCEQNTTEQGLV